MLLWLLLAGAVHAADQPFWKAKEKYHARVRDGEVIVAVNSEPRPGVGGGRRLTIRGGGRVRAPRAFTFGYARHLDRVAKTSDFVERAELKGDELKLTFAALGRRADFTLKVKTDAARGRMSFTVAGGPLDGLTADLEFAEAGETATEVGIDGRYDYEHRLRGALVGLGLEGVFRALAERLRDGAERAFRVDKAPAGVEGSGHESALPH